jgi:hypothetical protein
MNEADTYEKEVKMRQRIFLMLFVIFISIFVFLCSFTRCSSNTGGEGETGQNGNSNGNPNNQWILSRVEEQQMLDDTFRIDISTISVFFDYVPAESYMDCLAIVNFFMRPGQRRAVIHLEPVIDGGSDVVNSILLNNESLDISNESDVSIVSFTGTTQRALEFQRDLEENRQHTLEMSYRLELGTGYPSLISNVNDISGKGNEEIFPTINTPHELARHHLIFRIQGDTPYRCIGSGQVEQVIQSEQGEGAGTDIQQWMLDTEQEVASYTVMFAVFPEEDIHYEEHTIEGVAVRVMAYRGGASINEAFTMLEPWIPELIDNLGPFPMPHGISIFLTKGGGGMEYYGATISSLSVLKHEVFHMYYGCSTINKTYRDSWIDEAVNKWYEFSQDTNYQPITESFSSDMVSNRSPVAVGFDTRAYTQGAHIMEAVARELGGREEMIAFLKYIHSNYIFSPFTTQDFLEYLEDYAGVDMRDRFSRWVYAGGQIDAAASAVSAADVNRKHQVYITPPKAILKKYQR